MLDISSGLFLCPDIPAICGCHRFFDALLGDDYLGCSNGDSRFFINCYIQDSMQPISLSATRRRKPLVILTGPAIEAKLSTPITVRLSRALSKAWQWTRCNCTPVRIVRAMFSPMVSTAVAVIVIAAMYWHHITIGNTIDVQRAVGYDALIALPWIFVWAYRASRMPMPEKGGEA